MLLGIVLHGALSMAPIPWLVQDEQSSRGMGLLFYGIHLFRMPLFFLLSGYFSILFWQRRGLARFLRQRALRIALPLLVSIFTILPLLALSVPLAWRLAAEPAGTAQAVPTQAPSPLHWAAGKGDGDACAALIGSGADLEALDDRGSSPLHWAVYFGRDEAALVLIEAGADLERRNLDGRTPLDELKEPWTPETRDICLFLAGILRLDISPEQVPLARARIAEQIGLETTPLELPERGADEHGGRPFDLGHLWFLWYLLMLSVGLAALLAIAPGPLSRIGAWVASPLALIALVPAAAWFFLAMSRTLAEPPFGSHTSTGFAPNLPILGFYALFFAYGALIRVADPETRRITRGWQFCLALGLVAFPMALHATFEPIETAEGLSLWAALLQAFSCWALVLGLLGAAARLLHRERRWVRLVSDSSYWLYLMHLPAVLVLQGLVSRWPIPAYLKLAFICAASFLVLYATYLFLVRPTPIGWMLNGKKSRT